MRRTGGNRVTVEQAATELGLNPQGVRVQMQRGLLDIGLVVPSVQQTTKRTIYQYLIFRDKLDKVLGKAAPTGVSQSGRHGFAPCPAASPAGQGERKEVDG